MTGKVAYYRPQFAPVLGHKDAGEALIELFEVDPSPAVGAAQERRRSLTGLIRNP